MLLSLLNWDGINLHGYLYVLCSAVCYFYCKTTFDILIETWRTTLENSTTKRTKRALVLAN
jgi:hypothetical protein